MKLPITVLIMARNEEANIKFAINSVIDDFDQVIVVDSFSEDNTVLICRQYRGVELYQNKFEGWAEQRNWMLKNCNIRNEIVFFLDADEYLESNFIKELRGIIERKVEFSEIILREKFIFLGKHIKYAHAHPPVKRIFKKSSLCFFSEYSGAPREYGIAPKGKAIALDARFIHFDRNPINNWINKHIRYSDAEAAVYLLKKGKQHKFNRALLIRTNIKLFTRNHIWDNLPLLIRPFLYFVYRYFLLLGFLDGKEGLILCYLQAFWYQSMIDIKIIELRREKDNE